MKLTIVLLFCCLLAIVTPICLDPAQVDGECTACGSLDILIEGKCYPKIRGCMNYTAGPACVECQYGYVLSKGTCIREAVFYNQTNITEIPPVTIGTPTLTLDQIKLAIGEEYGSYFTDAHEKFLSEHTELGKGAIKSVDKIETKKGTFLIIIYQSDSGQKYEATAFINQTNFVSQFSFLPLATQRKDPYTANNLLLQIQGANLTGYFIFEIKLQGDNYTFNYMNPALAVTRIQFNRNDMGPLLSTRLTVKKLNTTDLAKQEMMVKYPIFATRKVTRVTRFQDFHIFMYSYNWTVSVRFNNFRFQVNKPVTTIPQVLTYNNEQISVDWSYYLALTNWRDAKYLACLQAGIDLIPEIVNYVVIDVTYAVVPQGTVFYIDTQRGYSSFYSIMALYTKDNTVMVANIYKNYEAYNSNYDYNQQGNFFKWYNISVVGSKVLNVPPIDRVVMKNINNFKTYKVIYNPNQYMEFSYNQTSLTLKLISYVVDGQDILPIINAAGPTDFKDEPDILLSYLAKTSYTSPSSFMESFYTSPLGAILTWVTSKGTYSSNLRVDPSSIAVNALTQISPKTCFDMGNWNTNKKMKSVDNFLRKYYNLNGYQVQLAQNKVNNIGNRYRMLYANSALKQIQFIVEQLYTLFNVIKTTTLNEGYGIVEPSITSADYMKMIMYLSGTSLAGTRVPILAQSTPKSVRGYYDDGKSTYEIVITKSTDYARLNNLNTRTYLLVPDGFKVENLLIPGTPTVTDQTYLNQFMAAILAKPQLVGATLSFADKQATGYNMLLRTPSGSYVKTVCNMVNSQPSIGPISTTTYKAADFSNCAKFSSTGQCLSCTDAQVEYQGYCWARLEGCMAQAGKYCLKCWGSYTLENRICKIACHQMIY